MSRPFTRPTAPRRRLAAAVVIAALFTVVGCAGSTGGSPTPDASSSASSGDLPESVQERLQSALDETMAQFDVPGAAVGVWIPGEGEWKAAAGLSDIEQGEPVDIDMSWPLRSITKTFTVTLLLQLVDEGEVALDDTIGQYVDGVTDGDEITLRELGEMSSGNADYTNEDFLAAFGEDPDRLFTLEELNGFVLGKPAQFSPGALKVYTNANTNLIGAVIEEVTGQDFADALEERILVPLNLQHTRYILDVETWTEPHAVGYAPDDGTLTPQPTNLSIFGPAGSMVSTLDDARIWGEALATGSLLQSSTQAERLIGAPLDAGPPYDEYALGIGETDGWWGHNGEGLGFTAALFHDLDSGATIAVFMNESSLADQTHPADQLFRRIVPILASVTSG